MERQLTQTSQTIRSGLMAGVVALIRMGDAMGVTTTKMQKAMHGLVDEARRRAHTRRSARSEGRRAGDGELANTAGDEKAQADAAPESTGADVQQKRGRDSSSAPRSPVGSEQMTGPGEPHEGDVGVPIEPSVSTSPSSVKRDDLRAQSRKRRGANRGATKKRSTK